MKRVLFRNFIPTKAEEEKGTGAATHGGGGGGSSSNKHGGLVEIRVDSHFRPNSWSVNKVVSYDEINTEELKLSDHETLEKIFYNGVTSNNLNIFIVDKVGVSLWDVTEGVGNAMKRQSFLKIERSGTGKRDRSKSFALGWKDIITTRHVEAGDEIALTCDNSSGSFQFELLSRRLDE